MFYCLFQVLIKVFTVAVGPIDTIFRQGKVPGGPEPPYIPGGDVSGIVHQCGNNVQKFMVI